MAYTTVSRVRASSGLSGNTNVLDAEIEIYITRAHAEVNAHVARKYVLAELTGSNWVGSEGEAYLESAENLMAAGWAMVKSRQTVEGADISEGFKKVEEGRKMLRALYEQPNPIILNGIDMNPMPSVLSEEAGGGITATGGDTDPIFTNSQIW